MKSYNSIFQNTYLVIERLGLYIIPQYPPELHSREKLLT